MTPAVEREVRENVAELLVRYATGIDHRDWALFRSCFIHDCEADYGEIGVCRSADEITAFMQQANAGCGHTMHRITNPAVTRSTNGVSARSYVDAIVLASDNRTGARAIGVYDDELVHTDDGWKIARRRFTMIRAETIGQ